MTEFPSGEESEEPAPTADLDTAEIMAQTASLSTAQVADLSATQRLAGSEPPAAINASNGPLVPYWLLRQSPAWLRNLQAAVILMLAMVFPGFALLVGLAGVWVARTVTKAVERWLHRRLQRGPRRWDGLREALCWPWRAIQVLPHTLVTCAVALAVGWLVREGLLVILDSFRDLELVRRSSQPALLALAAGVALLVVWHGPGARAVRGGVAVGNAVVAASRGLRRLLIAVAATVVLVALWRLVTDQPPAWQPVAIPQMSWNWLVPHLYWIPVDWPWQAGG